MRWVVALGFVWLAGCRQLLGFESASAIDQAGDDAAPQIDAALIDGPPPDDPVVPSGRKQTITIDPAKISGVLVEFPVWVQLENDGDLKQHAAVDGSDIHFTRTDGAFLAYEIEDWDSPTGSLKAWVKLDLVAGVPAAFDIRYAELAPAPPPAPSAVFSSSFDAVWHFEDVSAIADATGTHAGVASGGPVTAAAKLGHGLSFDGVDSKVSFVNTLTGAGASTFSAWVSVQAPSAGASSVITIGNSTTNQARYLFTKLATAVGAGVFGNNHSTNQNIDGAGFKLLHWTLGNGSSKIYIDGVLVGTDSSGFNNLATTGTAGTIGIAPNSSFGPNSSPLEGTLDEVRIATVERPAGWIATEFANQSSPQTFYSVGPAQIVP